MLPCNKSIRAMQGLAQGGIWNYFKLQTFGDAAALPNIAGQTGRAARSIPGIGMSEQDMRDFARAFCDALATGEPERLDSILDSDVEWLVYGPVDLFPLFGEHRGKDAVLTMCQEMAEQLEPKDCDHELTLGAGNQAAALIRLRALHRRTGRMLSVRLALFAQFKGGKLTQLRALFDSFDLAEQTLGQHFVLAEGA